MRPTARPSDQIAHLNGLSGILQVDGYGGYRTLAEKRGMTLAFCWAHLRRPLYELAAAGPAPITSEMLRHIAELYKIEDDIRGRSIDERRAARQARSRPSRQPRTLATRETRADPPEDQARRGYPLHTFTLGRPHAVPPRGPHRDRQQHRQRSIRPIALNRKALSSQARTVVLSIGQSSHRSSRPAKLNGVEPLGYLTDVLTRIVNSHPNSKVDQLLPWAYIRAPELKAVA
jgi:transposase